MQSRRSISPLQHLSLRKNRRLIRLEPAWWNDISVLLPRLLAGASEEHQLAHDAQEGGGKSSSEGATRGRVRKAGEICDKPSVGGPLSFAHRGEDGRDRGVLARVQMNDDRDGMKIIYFH